MADSRRQKASVESLNESESTRCSNTPIVADVLKKEKKKQWRKRKVGQLRDLLVPIFSSLLLLSSSASSISLLIYLLPTCLDSVLCAAALGWNKCAKQASPSAEKSKNRVKIASISRWREKEKKVSYYFISIINQHLEVSKVLFLFFFCARLLHTLFTSAKRESFAIQSSRASLARNNTRIRIQTRHLDTQRSSNSAAFLEMIIIFFLTI